MRALNRKDIRVVRTVVGVLPLIRRKRNLLQRDVAVELDVDLEPGNFQPHFCRK
jgi:hypothetical protein